MATRRTKMLNVSFLFYNFRKKHSQLPQFPINLNFSKIRDGGHIGGHFD